MIGGMTGVLKDVILGFSLKQKLSRGINLIGLREKV